MMKRITLLSFNFILVCLPLLIRAQTFVPVALDEKENPPSKDLRALHYAIDEAQDSLWLKFTFYDTTGGDFGLALGFDTNLVVTDGNTWGGNNQDMKYDMVIYLERNGWFEQYLRSSSTLVKSIVEEDSTVILNFEFSAIAPLGEFNLLSGTGGFDISTTGTVFDDLPDTDYITLPLAPPTGIDPIEPHDNWALYPNPANAYVNVSTMGNEDLSHTYFYLLSIDGRSVRKWKAGVQQQLDLTGVQQGLYLFVKENESGKLVISQLQVIR